MPKYKLTYFNIRGRAEVIRYLFAVAGVSYEDFRIEREEWPALKHKTLFGQIPLLEVDGKLLCQSRAISRYLAREFGLAGESDWEQTRVDMIMECMEDYYTPLGKIRQEEDAKKKEGLLRAFIDDHGPQCLDKLENIQKENGHPGYFVGSKITLADIAFYHVTNFASDYLGTGVPMAPGRWQNLQAVKENVRAHPQIKGWEENRPKTPM